MATLMKGHHWSDRFKRDRSGVLHLRPIFPAYVEPKVDEIRCEVVRVQGSIQFLSYAGKPLHNLGMYSDQFYRAMDEQGIHRLDIGIEVNGNFNDTYRYVRSSRGIPSDLFGKPIRFMLFDAPEIAGPYSYRRGYIQGLVYKNPWAEQLPAVLVHSEAEVEAEYERLRDLGLEGAMVKNCGHWYQDGKRSFDWLKMKPEETADGRIIELHEAISDTDAPEKGLHKGKPLGRIGSVTLEVEGNPDVLATPHGIGHKLGQDMYLNPGKYHHQWVEFSYMERDRQGGFRHPVFRRLREEK